MMPGPRAPLPPPTWTTLAHYFGLTQEQQDRVWQAILRAQWSVAKSWRHDVQVLDARAVSIDGILEFLMECSPPTRMLELTEVLVQEGAVSRKEMAPVQEKMLQRTTASGQWR